jgi:hypothetical protein
VQSLSPPGTTGFAATRPERYPCRISSFCNMQWWRRMRLISTVSANDAISEPHRNVLFKRAACKIITAVYGDSCYSLSQKMLHHARLLRIIQPRCQLLRGLQPGHIACCSPGTVPALRSRTRTVLALHTRLCLAAPAQKSLRVTASLLCNQRMERRHHLGLVRLRRSIGRRSDAV